MRMKGIVAEDLEAGKVAAILHAKRKVDAHIAAGFAAIFSWCDGCVTGILLGSSGCKAYHDADCKKQSLACATTTIPTHGLQSLNATFYFFGVWIAANVYCYAVFQFRLYIFAPNRCEHGCKTADPSCKCQTLHVDGPFFNHRVRLQPVTFASGSRRIFQYYIMETGHILAQ
jgi:hypothetical protein